MEGWISLHRKILENPILNRSRVYSNFEAWIWLLLKANHQDNKFMLGSDLVKVEKVAWLHLKRNYVSSLDGVILN